MFTLIYRLGIFSLKRWRDYTIHLRSLFLGALHIWMCVYLGRYSWFWGGLRGWPTTDTPSKHTASSPHCCLPTHLPSLLVREKANHCEHWTTCTFKVSVSKCRPMLSSVSHPYRLPSVCHWGWLRSLPLLFWSTLPPPPFLQSSLLSCQQFWALTLQWTECLCPPLQIHILNPKLPV